MENQTKKRPGLYAMLGETPPYDENDIVSLFEYFNNKSFIYRLYKSTETSLNGIKILLWMLAVSVLVNMGLLVVILMTLRG